MDVQTDWFKQLIKASKVSLQENDNIFIVSNELLTLFYHMYGIEHREMLKFYYLKEFIENHIIDSVQEDQVTMISGEVFEYIPDNSVDGIPLFSNYEENGIMYIILEGVLLSDIVINELEKLKLAKSFTKKQPKRNIKMDELNDNYRLADTLPLDDLEKLLKASEEAYYNDTTGTAPLLDDKVYNYAKEVFRVRTIEAGKEIDLDPMEHVPKPVGRLVKAPVWMGGIDKVNKGTGKLELWQKNYPGPYVVSAKMDGASALYFQEDGQHKLYSRGRKGESQNISELLQFLNLPALEKGQMIRGELILQKSVFDSKYKRIGDSNEFGKYKNSRNAVSGMVNRVGSRAFGSKSSSEPLNVSFLDDLQFVAYEVITNPPLKCSSQFEILEKLVDSLDLEKTGFRVTIRQDLVAIDDEILSDIYHEYLADIDYELDGLVVCSDQVYQRPVDENPPYMRAYKEELAVLTGITTVKYVKWKISKDRYIKPTISYEPLELGGVTNVNANGHNAKFIVDNKIGPGAVIEITRAGGINPKIINIVKQAEAPQLPEIDYEWNSTKVDFILKEESEESRREVNIRKLYFFLSSIGTKGIGEATVARMYDGGITTIPQFFTLTKDDISYLGPKASENVANAIYEKTENIPLVVMMSACGLFGRGMGEKTFQLIFDVYPDFMRIVKGLITEDGFTEEDATDLIHLLVVIKGIGEKTAEQIIDAFPVFLHFLNELENWGYKQQDYVIPAAKEILKGHPLSGKNVYMTGFRDSAIEELIKKVGGKIQSGISGTTNLLIIKDKSYENKKTEKAQSMGIEIMTRQEFIQKYLS